MRASTQVHAAIRNIGDSQDGGEFFQGTVKDMIFWLATQVGTITIQRRIVIGIGRNRDDAAMGINVERAGKSRVDNEMRSMLEAMFADDSDDESVEDAANQAQFPDTKIPGDDWQGA